MSKSLSSTLLQNIKIYIIPCYRRWLHTDAQHLHQILFYLMKQLYRNFSIEKIEDLNKSHIYAPRHFTKTWPKNWEENWIAVNFLTFQSIPVCLILKNNWSSLQLIQVLMFHIFSKTSSKTSLQHPTVHCWWLHSQQTFHANYFIRQKTRCIISDKIQNAAKILQVPLTPCHYKLQSSTSSTLRHNRNPDVFICFILILL